MSTEQVLTVAVLALTGFTACAEFGSYAFVHPVVRRLEVGTHVHVEQGLVRTFGRIMPVLMPLSLLGVVAWASLATEVPLVLRLVAAGSWAVGLVTTVLVNVRINLRTARWSPDAPAEEWRTMRRRWEAFQGVRSWAFLLSFLTVVLAVGTRVGG